MIKRFDAWAPPFKSWGIHYELGALAAGPVGFKVDLDTISDAPSTFDAEITYWYGDSYKTDLVVGPGSHIFSASCACIPKIRFRSHTMGQLLRITVTS